MYIYIIEDDMMNYDVIFVSKSYKTNRVDTSKSILIARIMTE